jgi:hypothetical protein
MVAIWAPVEPGFSSLIEPITAPVLSFTGVPTVKAGAVALASAPVPVAALGAAAAGGVEAAGAELDVALSEGAVLVGGAVEALSGAVVEDEAAGAALSEAAGLVLAWEARGIATARLTAARRRALVI